MTGPGDSNVDSDGHLLKNREKRTAAQVASMELRTSLICNGIERNVSHPGSKGGDLGQWELEGMVQ